MIFATEASTTEVAGWLTAAGVFLGVVVREAITWRKSRTASRREDQDLDHAGEAWAVKQARSLYRDVKDRMDALWEQERQCQIRLATIETQYADLKQAHEDTKTRLANLERINDSKEHPRLGG